MFIEKPLVSERITLRNALKDDLPALTAMWFDPENGKYLSDPTREYVDSAYQAALDRIEENQKGYYLAACRIKTGEIIGSCFFFPEEEADVYEIAYCVRKDVWRQGFGREIIALAISWVRGHGGKAIIAEAAKENAASHGLLKSTGFRFLRESSFKKYNMDTTYESLVYRLDL